jgi:hypothetical protein
MPKLINAGAIGAAMLASAANAQTPGFNFSVAIPTPGNWSYVRGADGGEAYFRDPTGRSQLIIRCARSQRRVTIAKPASGAAAAMNVWTSAGQRAIPASFDPATALLSVALPAFDGFADDIAFSRGRLGAGVAGAPALVVPAWPEVARVIEDCRV